MRKYYVDNIRWITILLVVIYHVIYMYNGVITAGVIGPFHEKQLQDGFLYLVYPWFMVILFIASGMSARYSLEKHTVKEFLKSRTRKLLVPSTIGLFVMGWIQGYISMEISHAFGTMPEEMPGIIKYLIMVLSGTGVLWFIQVLWVLSVVLCLIRRFEKGKLYEKAGKADTWVCVLLVVVFYLSGLVLNTPVIVVYRFGIYGFSFFAGYFLFAHEEVVERLSKMAVFFSLASVICGIAFVLMYFGKDYATEPVVNSVLASIYGWLMCLAILGGMKRWGNKENKFSRYMTEKCFGIYVFHYLPMSALALYLDRCTDMPAGICYLLIGMASLFGGLLLYEVISRLPVIRWCVLGIRKKG